MSQPFKNIAVIGSGTMGSGIAGHIANAGQKVLLLDLPGDESPGDNLSPDAAPNAISEAAVERLLASDPPALMDKSNASLIACGNMRDDFHRLATCDWIIEAVVERLDIKQDLYKRLDAVIKPDCVVTSNTSTIPIRVLTQDMPASFRRRFAITHYFNPVRYMRLLELVRGADTDAAVMTRLADYNDRFLGKGVVACHDTPGFLGNRVGVYALQVGIDEALRQGLAIEDADALMGRPMGIPKTGIFGLYDLIGIDLMADVVDTLETILPEGDAFFDVGSKSPAAALIRQMIADGYTGDKGKGGFYRLGMGGGAEAVDLTTGGVRPRRRALPPVAEAAAMSLAQGGEPLDNLIMGDLMTPQDSPEIRFSRRVLARVLGYAAGLIPDVTTTPQDIDDAMKLGFNWIRGPFEMIDAIGTAWMHRLLTEAEMPVPPALADDAPFYRVKGGILETRTHKAGDEAGGKGGDEASDKAGGVRYAPVKLPPGTIRFHMLKRCLAPRASNPAASLYVLGDDLRLVEFHSKANALNDQSMEIVAAAAADHGRGVIIHNDAQHFSAGVDLNGILGLIEAQDWHGIDAFLVRFQQAVRALAMTPVPVIAAPSGLTLGGGYEVLAHADKTLAHGNIVMGLVEAAVGLVPGGGGVRETYHRWHEATSDWRKAAWNTWMQIGYARTGTSPQSCAKLTYFVEGRDRSIMNRDKLLTQAMAEIEAMHKAGYRPPDAKSFTLPGGDLLDEMAGFMDKGIADGVFFPHDKTVAMAVGGIITHDGADAVIATEDDLYRREREAFLRLARTPQTKARIEAMLKDGAPIRN